MRNIMGWMGVVAAVVVGAGIPAARAASKEFHLKVTNIYVNSNASGNQRIEVQFSDKTGCNAQGKLDTGSSSVVLEYNDPATKYMFSVALTAKSLDKKVHFWIDDSTCKLLNMSPE